MPIKWYLPFLALPFIHRHSILVEVREAAVTYGPYRYPAIFARAAFTSTINEGATTPNA